ncbi:phosphonate ABC transporter, permease protein PhnE [Pelagibius sp.]|uniref:phosphonate ABC transporter, permease protein PhnE n=1 Tax=Pelagibius sp. TaxID=1931238 RepID=UPI003BB11FBB
MVNQPPDQALGQSPNKPALPARLERPGIPVFLVYLLALGFFILALEGSKISISGFVEGLPQMADLFARMVPPDISRIVPIGKALLETFQMALVGTTLGVAFSLPLAVLATRRLSPHPAIYYLSRGLISWFRTVPDLVWALFFVVTVGLGPFAGTLALMVDTMGFCGKFFAEAMEETEPGPQEALTALGASPSGVICSAVIPAAMPSFINTGLFSLEKATRSSVVLGLVGAGGIGIELKVAMDLFEYPTAATIIVCIFVLVLLVERLSSRLRHRIM